MNINIREYSLVKAAYGNVNFVTNNRYVIPWAITSIDKTYERI